MNHISHVNGRTLKDGVSYFLYLLNDVYYVPTFTSDADSDGKFPEIKGLEYTDDDKIIGPLSQTLKLISVLKPTFKKKWVLKPIFNLDFKISTRQRSSLTESQQNTMCLIRHVFDQTQHFFECDPDLQEIDQDFTLDMFTVEGTEVLGSHRCLQHTNFPPMVLLTPTVF